MVKFVPAFAYHLCLNLPAPFSQPRTSHKRVPSNRLQTHTSQSLLSMHTQIRDHCSLRASEGLQRERLPCQGDSISLVIGWYLYDFDLQSFFLSLLKTIAPLNHTLPESEERNRWSPEAMTEEELTALYFEQLDEQGLRLGSISSCSYCKGASTNDISIGEGGNF